MPVTVVAMKKLLVRKTWQSNEHTVSNSDTNKFRFVDAELYRDISATWGD